jgi:MFS family permease
LQFYILKNKSFAQNEDMWMLIRSLSAPLVSLIFMMMASGLFNTFVSVRLELEGYHPETIGLVTSCLYLGVLIGSCRIDRWISKVGHIRSFVTFAAVLALVVMAQSFWINPWYWSALRLIGGISMAGVFVVIESWILIQSPANMRGAGLSLYLAVLYMALSFGQFLIDLSDPMGLTPFCITAVLLVGSILPVSIHKIEEPKLAETSRLTVTRLFQISPHGFIGGIVSGMILAIVYGLVPVYAREMGMSVSEIGTFMAVLIFGGFSLQWPLGRLADKIERRLVLNGISIIAALLAISLGLLQPPSIVVLLVAWLFGGFSFTLYPISMACACDRVPEQKLVAATGGFVLSYAIGAVAGPLLAPIAMDLFGPSALFYFLASISTLLALVGLKRSSTAIIDE